MGSLVAACKHLAVAHGIQFPDQGSNPSSLHWEHRVLATEPSGNSLRCWEIEVQMIFLNSVMSFARIFPSPHPRSPQPMSQPVFLILSALAYSSWLDAASLTFALVAISCIQKLSRRLFSVLQMLNMLRLHLSTWCSRLAHQVIYLGVMHLHVSRPSPDDDPLGPSTVLLIFDFPAFERRK